MKAIGDNLITVARSNQYTAKQFRELFLYAIGDTESPPEGMEMVAELIRADQDGIKDRIEARAAANRERVRRAREKAAQTKQGDGACNASNASNAGNVPYHATPTTPTTPNSNTVVSKQDTTPPPTPSSDRAAAVAVMKRSFPTLDDVLVAAHNIGVPRDFAERFFADMTRDNWAYVNRHGNTATVNKLCLASVLGGRWRARSKGGDPASAEEITPEVKAAQDMARKARKH